MTEKNIAVMRIFFYFEFINGLAGYIRHVPPPAAVQWVVGMQKIGPVLRTCSEKSLKCDHYSTVWRLWKNKSRDTAKVQSASDRERNRFIQWEDSPGGDPSLFQNRFKRERHSKINTLDLLLPDQLLGKFEISFLWKLNSSLQKQKQACGQKQEINMYSFIIDSQSIHQIPRGRGSNGRTQRAINAMINHRLWCAGICSQKCAGSASAASTGWNNGLRRAYSFSINSGLVSGFISPRRQFDKSDQQQRANCMRGC